MNSRVIQSSIRMFRSIFFLLYAALVFPATVSLDLAAHGDEPAASKLANAIREYPLLRKPGPLELDQALATPQVLQVKLSGSGLKVAFASRENSGYSIWVMDTESQASRLLFQSRIIRSIEWSSDDSTLIMPTASGIGFADVETGSCGLFFRFNENLKDEFAGVDQSHRCHVLVKRTIQESGHKAKHQLLRIGLDGKQEIVFEDESEFYDFLIDSNGEISFIRQAVNHQHVIFKIDGVLKQEVLRTSALDMCSLLEFHEAKNRLTLAGYGDRDFRNLQSLDLANGTLEEVHCDPESFSDIDSITTDLASGEVLLASYYGDRTRNYGIAT